jgi:hypothetical protein
MILSFNLFEHKTPTLFAQRILNGLYHSGKISREDCIDFKTELCWSIPSAGAPGPTFHRDQNIQINNTKLHTIREDAADRWAQGRDIHFMVKPYHPDRYQFAPVLQVVSIQKIKLTYHHGITAQVDGETLGDLFFAELIQNDGFDTELEFVEYFFPDHSVTEETVRTFTGKIIHWTNLKY